jgi:hypothetical protein
MFKIIISCCIVFLFVHIQLYGQNFEHHGVFSNSGGAAQAGSITITGVLGESFEGSTALSGSLSLTAGFISTIVIDTDAPSITHTIIETAAENQPLDINATITDAIGIETATLYFRRGGDVNFSSVEMNIDGDDNYTGSIPASEVTSRGLEYFIKAVDLQGRESRVPSQGIISVRISIADVAKVSPQPAGSEQNAYRLISLPIDASDKNPQSVLGDVFGEYDISRWRTFELRENQTYSEFPNISPMAPGRAFWLITAEAGKNLATGAGSSVRTDTEYEISLNAGWTFIGNPFNFAIPLDRIELENNNPLDIRSFTGSWQSHTGPLQPFEGYAVHTNEATSMRINPQLSPAPQKPSMELMAEKSYPNSWGVQLVAESGLARDGDNWALVMPDASHGWDIYDRANPPVIGEYVNVYFPRPEWNTISKHYSTDARPVPNDVEVWDFEVKTNIPDAVKLTFNRIESIPVEYDVWLVDKQLQIGQNLRQNNFYEFRGLLENTPKKFLLMIGRTEFVEQELNKFDLIPSSYVLFQNFPNPFNPSTTVKFGLPRDSHVTVTIYDIMGREIVRLLVDEERSAGYHTVVWDGRNRLGYPVASGMYIYNIRAGDYSENMRMLMLK